MSAEKTNSDGEKTKNNAAEDGTDAEAKDPSVDSPAGDAETKSVDDADVIDAVVDATEISDEATDDPSFNDLGEDDEELSGEDVDAVEEVVADAEEISEVAAEPTPEPVPDQIVERVIERRGGFFPALIGGVLAAILGFAAGASDVLAPYLPVGLQRNADADATGEELAALRTQVTTLQTEIQNMPAPVDLSGIESRLADQQAATDAVSASLTEQIETLRADLTKLAQAPVEAAVSEEAVAAFESELSALQAALAQQRSEVEQMMADATQAAISAEAQAALGRIVTALESGDSFADEVAQLSASGIAVPDGLANAADGVATLTNLQADFPTVARDALSAARDQGGGAGGLSGFLQKQLGARSVAPREGDDPDAVLSRAEAAVRDGNLQLALSELGALPEIAQTQLTPWVSAASGRLAAQTAASELEQSLRAN